ncbi:hypothetical protein G6F56_009151 [Rhizopus delemar]|nr:hypothetical protein G6F56_009151 [Rhizopus delemar]
MSKNNSENHNHLPDTPTMPSYENNVAPSAPPPDESIELPTYDTATAGSSQPVLHPLSGKPISQHNDLSRVSDNDFLPMPAPLPSFEPSQNIPPAPYLSPSSYPSESALPSHSVIEVDEEERLLSGQAEFDDQPAPPGYSVYKAKLKFSRTGNVFSRDKHINNDREALSQFIYQNNTPPSLIARFYGYHEETHWITRVSRNTDGEEETEREPETHRVEDFCFKVDLSEYVSPNCLGIYVMPDSKNSQLKKLKLTKEVTWDYSKLVTALSNAIRSAGVFETIEIKFLTEKSEINVKSSHWYSRILDNPVFRVFLFLSFMWIYIIPFNYFYKKFFGHSTMKSEWGMTISEYDWYHSHAQEIVTMCQNKLICKGKTSRLFSRFQPPNPSFPPPQQGSVRMPQGPS